MSRTLASLLVLLAVGCKPDDDPAASESETSTDSTGETGETGESFDELFGLLTVTHYPADAAGFAEQTDVAGGLRREAFEGIEDLVSLVHLQTTFAPASAELDELVVSAPAPPWSFGLASSWLTAGDGITLRGLGLDEPAEISGCRRGIGKFGEFPVYVSGGAEVPEPCRSDTQGYLAPVDYALIVYGGALFEDEIADEVVTTPEPFEVSAPDISIYELELARDQALSLSWTAPSEEPAEGVEQRFVIRLWDASGTIATMHATDDGSASIPAEALMQLEAGPATITFARETQTRASLSVGTIDVLVREEQWGYLELF